MFHWVRAARRAAAVFVCVATVGWTAPATAQQVSTPAAGQVVATAAVTARAGEADVAAQTFSATVATSTATPAVAAAVERSLGDLIAAHSATETANAEQDCLASAIYFEARGEPVEGQLAVAEVVMNRAVSGRYPPTLCGVVRQRAQFSFVRSGRIPAAARGTEAWRRAVAIARIAQAGSRRLLPQGVLWYHANYVSPGWSRRLSRNTRIGLHIFYASLERSVQAAARQAVAS